MVPLLGGLMKNFDTIEKKEREREEKKKEVLVQLL